MSNPVSQLFSAAFAFRGYNTTNLGRTAEFLAHPVYGATMQKHLADGSQICADVVKRPVDLIARVQRNEEASLEEYDEAVALIVAVEMAQLQLLKDYFAFDYSKIHMAFGYSLGEIAALVASNMMSLEDALKIPLAMAKECVELAHDATLGVLFSRGPAIDLAKVDWLCLQINAEGQGVIGVSSYLAPNSILLIGQGTTIDRFGARLKECFPYRLYLRKNEHLWPPMHTPIIWQRAIPNRAAVMLHTIQPNPRGPVPPVFSLVTGNMSYDELTFRETLTKWIDHPQRLWDAVNETLVLNCKAVVHVGPEPNLILATFNRLAENVKLQTGARSLGGFGLRAVASVASRPWLARMLPSRSTLLRAPGLRQIILEDWLLENSPG